MLNKRLEWNLKCDPIGFNGIIFHSWKELSYNFLTQEHWRLTIFFLHINVFHIIMRKFRAFTGFIFYFWFRSPQKIFFILSSSLILSEETFGFNERKTIFELAKVLKAIILRWSVRRRILQTFKTFWILVIRSRKIFTFAFPCYAKSRLQ